MKQKLGGGGKVSGVIRFRRRFCSAALRAIRGGWSPGLGLDAGRDH